MNKYILLLAACLMTAPAVAAEEIGPLDCDVGTEEGQCTLSNPVHYFNGPEEMGDEDCPSLNAGYNPNAWLPANVYYDISCF